MLSTLQSHGVDRLILLGDLVDRGPDSIECLEIARTYQFTDRRGLLKKVETVLGNHEDGYLRVFLTQPKPGRKDMSLPAERDVFSRITTPQLRWLAFLPIYIHIEELNLTCLHGGVAPWQQGWEEVDEWTLRMRWLDKHGEPLGWSNTSDRFWADDYDGRFGFIAFGHESWARPTWFPHALGLDGHIYQKIHGAVFSNEDDSAVEEFTVPYRPYPTFARRRGRGRGRTRHSMFY
jgi:hypothetical protein